MNQEIALKLEIALANCSAQKLRFRVAIENRSKVNLLLPWPRVEDLTFGNNATMAMAEWHLLGFESSLAWDGITLNPGEQRLRECRVPLGRGDRPFGNDGTSLWHVDLSPGEYLVWLNLTVGRDYYCPN